MKFKSLISQDENVPESRKCLILLEVKTEEFGEFFSL